MFINPEDSEGSPHGGLVKARPPRWLELEKNLSAIAGILTKLVERTDHAVQNAEELTSMDIVDLRAKFEQVKMRVSSRFQHCQRMFD